MGVIRDSEVINILDRCEARGMHHNLPIVWDRAKDVYVWDINNKKYLDFTSGIFTTNCGHGAISNAIKKQADKLIHCYSFPNAVRADLADYITEFTGFQSVFFLSAGTEATEAAVKIMRNFTKRKVIVSFAGAMHGKTMLAEQLKGNYEWANINENIWHLQFPVYDDSFENALFDCPWKDRIAGFIIETYRGWDARFLPTKYVKDLVKFARNNNSLVCFDEIQGGFGRTGKMFAYEHYDIKKPDLVCCGKGLGGGMPISAVLGAKVLLDTPSDLSSTHSANPLCCAGALESLKIIKNKKLIENSYKLGHILQENLDWFFMGGYISDYNSIGLLASMIFKDEPTATHVCERLAKEGLLTVKTGRESIKIGPPLSITKKDLLKGISIIEKVLCE